MKGFFTYIRVSTVKQGERGVSLPEQRDAIERYAQESHLPISDRFEDRETAAVQGRPAFNRMLQQLKAGRASGVIFYKVDRSSRNSADWARVDGLADLGIEVHFAHERLVLARRGDRLTANVQAVLAADYIRDLRDKVKMGYYGRLKQGFFPRPAPLGYLDNGGGKVKTVNQTTGPLIRILFESYATGRFSLRSLRAEAERIGLRTKHGKSLRLTQIAEMLHNPFYAGVIRVQKTRQSFAGLHEALVPRHLFERVQDILQGKAPRRMAMHDFLFRRLLQCSHCHGTLIGERQKGRVYYRCHTTDCPTTTTREDVVEAHFRGLMAGLRFTEKERQQVAEAVSEDRRSQEKQREAVKHALALRLANVRERFTRLTTAYVDGAIEPSDFDQRKTALLMERRDLEGQLAEGREPDTLGRLTDFLELAMNADSLYEHAIVEERRELIRILTSNRVVDGRTPHFTLSSPFHDLVVHTEMQDGGPSRYTARTRANVKRLLRQLVSRLVEPELIKACQRSRDFLLHHSRNDPLRAAA